MTDDYLLEVLKHQIDAGRGHQSRWWDERRIPLDSIDKPVTDLLDLRGRRAVVTGGAGLNLGQACVNRLAALGADVAVVDLPPRAAQEGGRMRWATPPDAEAVATAAAKRWGVNVVPVHGDVMEWNGVQQVMRDCEDALGGIDILVNNAADCAVGDFATMTHEDLDRTVRGTLVGPLYCTRAVIEPMIARGRGHIVNIGSEAGMTAIPGLALYGTMKAGLAAFTRYVGKEVGRHGVHVNAVNAGSMWGPDRPLTEDSPSTLYARARTAIQRYELPEEVANMVAFLASDAASAMVGAVIDMGGGMSI